MTATAPTTHLSSLASAQSLRLRYGRLSPLRLGIYGLVSLGSHLLLLGLFRWAWQVQLATQPVGSPIGIDFVEVDLSDGSFDGQRPDASGDLPASGDKLSAAQLNELIAQGETAPSDAVANAETLDLAPDAGLPEGAASSEVARANGVTAEAPQANGAGGGDEPRSWFPDLPILPWPTRPTAQPQPNRDDSSAQTNDAARSDGAGVSEGAIAEGSPGDGSASPSNGSPDSNSSETSSSDTNRPASSTGTEASATGGDSSEGSGGDGASGSAGRPNDLPPNISDQPVSPDQTVQPGETDLPDPDQPAPNQPAPPQGDDATGNPANDGGTNPGSGSGTSGENPAGEPPKANNPANNPPSGGNGSDAVPRLGASLDIDEVQSRAQNTQDVFTQLPKPLGDPLSNGSPSAIGGRCAAELASLTPASYGQPVQLILAVDKTGEVFYAEALDSVQAQTPVGKAIICLAREWPFEPAKREIDEGGGKKIENTGAELVVTVTISLLE